MRSPIEAILFDLDDTLIDRQRTQSALLTVILGELPELFTGLDRQKIGNAFYVSDQQSIAAFEQGASQDVVRLTRGQAFLELLDLPQEQAPRIAELYMHHYPLVGRPVPGAGSVLAELSRNYPLGLVSNGFADMQRRKMDVLGFSRLFDCMVFSSQAGFRKPHPKIFQQAALQVSCTPPQCVFVGDSYDDDVIGARAAGMQTCWYNPEGTRLLPKQHKPDFEIGALSAVAKLVVKA